MEFGAVVLSTSCAGLETVRPQHQLRAYDEEWDLIRRFARLVKHGKMEACKAALDQLEAADGK